MVKIRLYLLAIIVCNSILWIGATQAIKIEKKQQEKKQVIELKPFVSDQDMREAFIKLWEREELLKKKNDMKKKQRHIEKKKYRADLIVFFQRLFRSIVKADIENNVLYTQGFGLKIASDNQLTQDMLQMDEAACKKQNSLLFQLSLDPENGILISQLKNVHQLCINPTPSADKFFPEIVVLNNETWELEKEVRAQYNTNTNVIYIRKKHLSTRLCDLMIHEFTHRLQYAQGIAQGGITFTILDNNSEYSKYPLEVALEAEADLYAIKKYPLPGKLFEITQEELAAQSATVSEENILDYFSQNSIQLFPYIRPITRYAMLRKLFNFEGNTYWNKIADGVNKKLTKTKKQIIPDCLDYFNGISIAEKQYPICLNLLKQTVFRGQKFEEITEKIRINLCELTPEQAETINNTQNYRDGCQLYFELKKKYGLIPK